MSSARIGRYEILRPLGRGAMGVVYLARDPQIERVLALKTVRFDSPHQSFTVDEAKARFLKEAKISGRLQHPHIVTIYDVGEDQGTLFLAMEYISGGSLQQKLAEPDAQFGLVDRLRVIAEVADALAHAHQRGVIHRDIKPANIMLTEQLAAKVTDFGIGKLVSGDADLTSTGQMVGSPAYMSPEQIKGEKLDVRSDIFSLGVVMYQSLTQRKPFPADTLTTLVYQILNEEPTDPLEIRADLPPEVVPIIGRCLAKKREERYADAGEMAEEIREILGISPVGATGSLSESKIGKAREKAQQAQQAEQRTIMLDLSGRPLATPLPASTGKTALPPTSTGRMTPPPISTGKMATPLPAAAGQPAEPAEPPPPSEASGSRKGKVDRSGTGSVQRPPGPGKPGGSGGLLLAIAGAVIVALGAGGFWLVRSGAFAPPPTPVPVVPTAVPVPTPEPSPLPTPEAQATPLPEVTPTPEAAAAEPTPHAGAAPKPTRPQRPKPTVRPTAAPTAAPTKAAVATAVPQVRVDQTVVVRRFVKLTSEPSQARVFLDGRYVGIVDDWDDSGGGALLTFLLEGKHRIRLAYPGKRDLNIDVVVSASAGQDLLEVDRALEDGSPSGTTGPEGKVKRPSHRTVGALRFKVEPPETRVILDGRDVGLASQWTDNDLQLKDNVVHDVVLQAPSHEPRDFRVICALSTREARAVIKEKLKAP